MKEEITGTMSMGVRAVMNYDPHAAGMMVMSIDTMGAVDNSFDVALVLMLALGSVLGGEVKVPEQYQGPKDFSGLIAALAEHVPMDGMISVLVSEATGDGD